MKPQGFLAGMTATVCVAAGAATWWLARRFSTTTPASDLAWLLVPYALLLLLALITVRTKLGAAATLLAAMGVAAFGLSGLSGIFGGPPDGQGMLGVIAVVLIQSLACAAVLPVVLLARLGRWVVAPQRAVKPVSATT